MNNTEDIDLTKYQSYYALKSTSYFQIILETPNGEVEYLDYDVFNADDCQIIAFPEFNIGKTEYNYVVKSDGGDAVVQWLPYEYLYEYLIPSLRPQDDVFGFYNSVSMARQTATNDQTALSYDKRCDTELYMAIGYKIEDGIKPFVVDLEKFNDNTIKSISTILNLAGTASLTYLRVSDVGTSFRDYPAVSGMSKTFMGCLKLIIEWASLADAPFGLTDEIVLDAKAYLAGLNMPQTVIDEINNMQEDMPLYRYLKGLPTPRNGFAETVEVSPLFLNWLKSQVRYVSLNSLVSNVENPPNISKSKLAQEKELFETTIYANLHRYTSDESSVDHEYLLNILSNPNILTRNEVLLLKRAILWHRARS